MNIPKNIWQTGVAVLGVFAAFLLVLTIKEIKTIGYIGKSDQNVDTISVSGKGEAVAIPDIGTFSFTVDETAPTVEAAQTAATNKTNAAIKAVKDGGVADKDIKTTGYNINPHYEYQQGICPAGGICRPSKQVLTGYEVSQTIEVKVRDLKKAGALFASIGSLGVQNVNNLIFSIEDIEGVKAKARADAIKDAQAKAKELASELGVTIIRVNSFSDDSTQPQYGMGADSMSLKSMSAAPAAPPEVPTGEQKVISNVSITYEIK